MDAFEAAADAVVNGDLDALERLLGADAQLVLARSARPHHATLLHYTAANGVEDERQRTPANIVAVARRLLAAGAEVDAENHAYDGHGSALGLVASSCHPEDAGVQLELMELLVEAGAAIEGLPGGYTPLLAAVANGRARAGRWLVEHGARTTLVTAAAVGREDLVLAHLQTGGDLDAALRYACQYGHTAVVELLVARGADVAANDGMGPLHWAAHAGAIDVVRLLLARGAPLETLNRYGGTPLDQALWSVVNARLPVDHLPVIEALIAAGAHVDPSWSTGNPRIDEALRRALGSR